MTRVLKSHLLESIASMYNEGDSCDVGIDVGLPLQSVRFKAHGMILMAVSPFFKERLMAKSAEKENGLLVIRLPDIAPAEFEPILQYIYKGSISMAAVLRSGVQGTLFVADKLQLGALLEYIQDEIVRKHQDWLESHQEKMRSISAIPSCGRLRTHYKRLLDGNERSFSTSADLSHDMLKEKLEQGTIQLPEIEVWETIIKWGISQMPESSTNVDMWTDAEFEMLKAKVADLVSFVRFTDISSVDFCNRILPYKQIIPEILFQEVLYFQLNRKVDAIYPFRLMVRPLLKLERELFRAIHHYMQR